MAASNEKRAPHDNNNDNNNRHKQASNRSRALVMGTNSISRSPLA